MRPIILALAWLGRKRSISLAEIAAASVGPGAIYAGAAWWLVALLIFVAFLFAVVCDAATETKIAKGKEPTT